MRLFLVGIAIALAAAAPARAACDNVFNVRQPAGGDFTTIQAAVTALPNPIPSNWCINVDSSTYGEQVTVQNYTFTYSSDTLTIQSDPALASTQATISPPAPSTAAFHIMNASVTLANFMVTAVNPISYGVQASSGFITISSVNVDSGGNIAVAGISLSSQDAVSYSSVTVQAAHGFLTSGTGNLIADSTAASNSASYAALYLNGASSNTVTRTALSNAAGDGARLDAGGAYNTISLSTMTSGGFVGGALVFSGASSNTVSQSYVFSPVWRGALFQANANDNTISLSTVAANTSGGCVSAACALYIQSGTSNTVTQSRVSNPAGLAALVSGSFNTLSLSTFTGGGTFSALNLNGSRNTVTQSYMHSPSSAGLTIGIFLVEAASNTVSQSTIASDSGPSAVLIGDILNLGCPACYNTFDQCAISNPGGSGVLIDYYASGNTISRSTVTTPAAGFHALQLRSILPTLNTVTGSYLQASTAVYGSGDVGLVVNSSVLVATGAAGAALWLDGTSGLLSMSSSAVSGGPLGAAIFLGPNNSGSMVISTNTIRPGSTYGIYVATQQAGASVWITSNTILPTLSAARDTYGIYLNGLVTGATIQNNGIYHRVSGSPGAFTSYGLYGRTVSKLKIDHNRVSQPGLFTGGGFQGVYLTGASDTMFKFNDVHSTGTGLGDARLLSLAGNSSGIQVKNNVFSSSWTVTGSSASLDVAADSQSGFVSDFNDFFSSNSLNTGLWGTVSLQFPAGWQAGTGQDANSIASHPRWINPSGGVEDFHPMSQAGRFDPATQTFVLDAVSSQASDRADPSEAFSLEPGPNGARANQGSFGNTAEASKTPSCATSAEATAGVSSIQSAVNLAPPTLTSGDHCVTVGAGVYAEQVTVQNINANGFRILITSAPGAAVVLSPPATSTGAFVLRNTSVVITGISVLGTNAMPYGILASSPSVILSSVNVDSAGKIGVAGLALTSASAVSYSSVTVQAAHALLLAGDANAVYLSTLASAGAGFHGLFINGGSTNTVTQSAFSSASSTAAFLSNASSTTISRSTITAGAAFAALWLNNASNNAVTDSFIWNSLSTGVYIGDSSGNTISLSTVAVDGRGASALFLIGSTSNTVTQSFLSNSLSTAAALSAGGANTISLSTITSNNASVALWVNGSSSNTFTQLYIGNSLSTAAHLSNSANNSVSLSTITGGGPGAFALLLAAASSNTVSQSIITGGVAVSSGGVNTISFSAVSAGAAGASALLLTATSSNTVSQTSLTSALSTAAAFLGGGANSVSQSTIASNNASAALWLNASSSNTFSQLYIENSASTAAYIANSVNNSIGLSMIVSGAPGASAVFLAAASSNTFSQSFLVNAAGFAAYLSTAGANTISQSTMTGGSGVAALYINGSSNVVTQSYIENAVSTAALLDAGAVNNTIRLSTITSNSAASALFFRSASSNTLFGSVVTNGAGYGTRLLAAGSITIGASSVAGSTAAFVWGSTSTSLSASVFTATNSAGSAVWFGGGGVNLSLSSNTLTGGASGSGLFLDTGNDGAISIASTTIKAAGVGLNIATQTVSAVFSVSSMTFGSLAAGATAVNFLGGGFTFSLTALDFADTNIGINVNASPLAPGSQVTMITPKGPRTGPGWADDPQSLLLWPDAVVSGLPAGCAYGYNVKKDATLQFTAIQAALNGLAKNLTGDACVVVRDAQTYGEQVTVQGFTNNGFKLLILPDPVLASAPLLAPPAASTAAFHVLNDSVTLQGFDIRPAAPIPYGISASSSYVTISTINIDSGGAIAAAGMLVSSFAAVSYSSVTVQAAHAMVLTSTGAAVSFSTMAASGASSYGLFLNGASAALVTQSVVLNPASTAAFVSGGTSNTISRSTVASASAGSALWIKAAASTRVSLDFLSNPAGHGAFLDAAVNTYIDRSAIISTSPAAPGLFISGQSTTLTLSTVLGSTAVVVSMSTGTSIDTSVLRATGTAGTALWVTGGSAGIAVSSNNLLAGAQGIGILLDSGNSGVLSLTSTTISGPRFGLAVATQAAGASISVASMTFQSLASGATAVFFLGGVPVTTFTAVNFADAGISIDVDASGLGAAARVTMDNAVGGKSGPCFEHDPAALVDWPNFTACGLGALPFTGVVSSSLTANWSSTFGGGTFYYAQLSTGAFPNVFSGNVTTVTAQTSAGFINLTPNTAYFAQVSPNSAAGPFTNLGSTTTPVLLVAPSTPSVAAVGISLVNWTWSAVPGALGYKVFSASSPASLLASVGAPAFADTALATNTAHGVLVAAFNAGGLGPLSLSATAFTLAVAPSSMTAPAVYPGSATIAWELNTSPSGTTAELQRSTDNANFGAIMTAAATFYTDPSLQDCSTYFYRVRHHNGDSLPTGFASAISVLTLGLVPVPASGLNASAQAGNTIALSWNFSPSTAVVSQYRLYFDSGTGVMDYAAPLMVFTSTETSWVTGVLPSSAAYSFVLRTKTTCGVEETAGVTARAPSITELSARRAAIKAPESGRRIRGDSVSVIAELTRGTLEQTKQVVFQFRPSGLANWSTIPTSDFNHLNPATVAPFVVHWNVTGLAPGLYDLRAVAGDFAGVSDSAPESVTVNVLGAADPTFDMDESLDPVTGAVVKTQVLNNAVANTVSASGAGAADPVAKVRIPAGALNAASVTLTAVCNPTITTAAPSGFTSQGSSVRITLSNGQTTLGSAADLTLTYPAGAPTDRLVMLSLNEGTGRWSEDFSTTVNTDSQTISGLTPHFSIFAIFASAGGPTSNLANVEVYPVPFKPNAGNPDEGKPFIPGDATTGITFDKLPAAVSIRIYTLAGRLVAKFDTAAGLGKLQWDGRNMEGKESATGGYFAVISSPDQKSVVKRLMIIR